MINDPYLNILMRGLLSLTITHILAYPTSPFGVWGINYFKSYRRFVLVYMLGNLIGVIICLSVHYITYELKHNY